jgi:hypothetical protein
MKRGVSEAFVVAILLALPGVLVIEGLFFPDILGVSLVPMGVFGVALWQSTSRKKHARAVSG